MLPDQGIPEVRDTWLSGGTAIDSTHYTSEELVVGQNGNDGPKSALLSIPLEELPQRSSVRIVKAELSLWALTVNTTAGGALPPRISAHPTLRGWTDAANGTTSNGTWNWSGIAGLGSNETGELVDVGEPTSSSWFTLNVTARTYTPPNNLTVGQTWYWRVRGSSVTNQLGNWSQTAYFEVPNINAAWEDATTSWVEI